MAHKTPQSQKAGAPSPVMTVSFGPVPGLIKSSALTALVPLLVPGRVLRLETDSEDAAARLLTILPRFFAVRGLPMLRFVIRGNGVVCSYPGAN